MTVQTNRPCWGNGVTGAALTSHYPIPPLPRSTAIELKIPERFLILILLIIIISNLLKNAVEATPRGGKVEVHAHAASGETRPHLIVQVRDTGPGIHVEAMAHIFEPFFTMGKPKGTGLGLYVSHGIVERHGGELLASNYGSAGGAIFTLKLPLDGTDNVETL